VPLTLIPEIVRLEFPVFFTPTTNGIEPPTTSLPKLRLEVESEMIRVAEPPLPLNATFTVEFEALLEIVNVPVTLPVAVGAKFTVMLNVCPAEIVAGRVIEFRLNPVPLTLTPVTVMLALLLLLITTVCEFLVPVATVPKLTLVGVTPNVCACAPVTEKSVANKAKHAMKKYRQRVCRPG
jgi:hypothetical protein